VAISFVTLGCGAKPDQGTPTGSTCPPASTLTYANFGQAFISTNCLGCHNGTTSPRLSTQSEVAANAGAIDRQAAAGPNATNTFMPRDHDVPIADRTRLGEWLACGAP
jgi:hypothetical protein